MRGGWVGGGLVITDTKFVGVLFHAIKILPSLPQENASKKKKERERKERVEREKVPPLKESLSQARVAPQWPMKRWIERLSCLVIRKRGRAGVPQAVQGWPEPALHSLCLRNGVGGRLGGAERGSKGIEQRKIPRGTMEILGRDGGSPGALNVARLQLPRANRKGAKRSGINQTLPLRI